jgi:hypothetical protein
VVDRASSNGPEMPSENPVTVRRPLRLQIQEVTPVEPQSSATRKLADNQIAFCTRLDNMDADLVGVGRDMILGFAAISEKMDALAGLPLMRRQSDSIHIIDEISERIGETARVKAQQITDDPNSNLTPDVVKDMMKAEVKEALAQQREAERIKQLEATAAKVEADRVAAVAKADSDRVVEDERRRELAREKRESRRSVRNGIIVGVVVAMAGAFIAFTQGRLTGHGEGFAERGAIPPAVVPVPVLVPAATATASPALPAPVVSDTVAPKHH